MSETVTTARAAALAAAEERRIREPLVFGGLPEAQGWALAPITPRDRVHFRTDRELPLARFRAALPADVTVTYDEGDGLYRVDGRTGSAEAPRPRIPSPRPAPRIPAPRAPMEFAERYAESVPA